MVGQQQGRCRTGENLGKAAADDVSSEADPSLVSDATERYEPPKLLSREVLASGVEAEEFGWQLEATRAWQLGNRRPGRQAFVADGLAANWTIQPPTLPVMPRRFSRLDARAKLCLGLAAVAVGASYRQWADWIWQGHVAAVIAALTLEQQRLGPPPEGTPRRMIRAQPRRPKASRPTTPTTDCGWHTPQYRQQGLPLTSSHMESTVKKRSINESRE